MDKKILKYSSRVLELESIEYMILDNELLIKTKDRWLTLAESEIKNLALVYIESEAEYIRSL